MATIGPDRLRSDNGPKDLYGAAASTVAWASARAVPEAAPTRTSLGTLPRSHHRPDRWVGGATVVRTSRPPRRAVRRRGSWPRGPTARLRTSACSRQAHTKYPTNVSWVTAWFT